MYDRNMCITYVFLLKNCKKKYELTIAHCLVRKGKAHVTFFAPDAVPVIHDRDHGGDNDDRCDTLQ